MTCQEFERVLPELEGGRSSEHENHLRTCPRCSQLVADLRAIQCGARQLQACEEPSPRVWNSIEIALRQEGLIRQQRPVLAAARNMWPGWRVAWLAAVAALLVGLGIRINRHVSQPAQLAMTQPMTSSNPEQAAVLSDDEQVLKLVGSRAPALRAAFAADLRSVNSYIHDAELSAKNNPNDEVAQQYLVNAYQQRAMIYEMALDRPMQ
jgi:hypothetical protein